MNHSLGLNVGLQNLTSGLSGLQNVQVSIPGLPVPISLSLNPGVGAAQQQGVSAASASHPVILASPQHQTVRLIIYSNYLLY